MYAFAEPEANGIAFGLLRSATPGSMTVVLTKLPAVVESVDPVAKLDGLGSWKDFIYPPGAFDVPGVDGLSPKSRPLLFVSRPSTKRPILTDAFKGVPGKSIP